MCFNFCTFSFSKNSFFLPSKNWITFREYFSKINCAFIYIRELWKHYNKLNSIQPMKWVDEALSWRKAFSNLEYHFTLFDLAWRNWEANPIVLCIKILSFVWFVDSNVFDIYRYWNHCASYEQNIAFFPTISFEYWNSEEHINWLEKNEIFETIWSVTKSSIICNKTHHQDVWIIFFLCWWERQLRDYTLKYQ